MSNLSYLSDYQTFADKHELNHHVKRHLDATYDELNATDRQVFKFIARYAVKYAGASHLKLDTIANFIERTPRTTRNILAKLERLNMIERISRNRPKTGGRGANIIVIKPYTSEPTSERTSYRTEGDKPTDTTEAVRKTKKEPLRKLDLINNSVSNTYYTCASTYYSTPAMTPYKALKQAITTFIGEDTQSTQRTVSRLYGVYLGQTKPLRKTEYYSGEGQAELVSAALQAIQETFKATKRKHVRNIAGYYNGVLSNKLDDLMTRIMGSELSYLSDEQRECNRYV